MLFRKHLRAAFLLLALLMTFSLGAGGGYLVGTGQTLQLPQLQLQLPHLAQLFPQHFAAPEAQLAGPPPLWVSGDRLVTPPGQHVELRVVTLPPDIPAAEASVALGPGITAIRIPVRPDGYLADETERQRVAETVSTVADASVYPVIAVAASGGDCGAEAEARLQFWQAVAADLARWPALAFDVGEAGCAADWPRAQELAAAEIDAIRQGHPAALVLAAAPDGMTAADVAERRVPRDGVVYRVRTALPVPGAAVQPPALAGLPVVLELPPLPEGTERLLQARIAMSDIIAARPAGWMMPDAGDATLGAVAATALRGAVRAGGDEPGGLPRLRAEGNRVVDATGKAVKLYGFNRPGMEVFQELHHAPTTADLDEMARRGANLLRLPVNPVWYRTQPEYRAAALQTIAEAEQRGLYTLLDLHWSTLTGEAVCHPEMATATRFWQEAAFDLRGKGSVIYDIYNEPCKIGWLEWRPLAEQMIDAIRAVDPAALVMVPGVDWAYDLRGVGDAPVRRENVVYNAHDYPWKAYLDREQAYGYLADRYPVFIGEFGADYTPRYGFYQDPVAFTQALLEYVERRGLVGWAAWAWHAEITPNMFMDARFTPTPFGRAVLDRLAAFAAEAAAGQAGAVESAGDPSSPPPEAETP